MIYLKWQCHLGKMNSSHWLGFHTQLKVLKPIRWFNYLWHGHNNRVIYRMNCSRARKERKAFAHYSQPKSAA